MDALTRVVEWTDSLSRYVSIVLVGTITVVMLGQVFFRYVINSSLQWSEELSVWALIWMVFVGSAVSMRDWSHINIPTFVNLLPPNKRAYVVIFAKLATITFLAAVVWYGIEVFNAPFNARSINLEVSTRWVKLSMPVGAALMMIFALNAIILDLVNLRRGNYDHFASHGTPGAE